MRNIKKTLYLGLSTMLVFMAVNSCSDDLESFGNDDSRPRADQTPIRALTPSMQLQTHRNLVSLGGRLSGIIMQYYEGFDAQQVQYTQYNIGETDVDDLWDFGLYAGSMADSYAIIQKATESDAFHARGVAKIYMAANLGIVTALWGDAPYSESFLGAENLRPAYDSQQSIYTSIQTLLDEAIVDLELEDNTGTYGDLVGGESPTFWVAVATALKSRYYLHLTSRSDTAAADALAAAQEAILLLSGSQPDFTFEASVNGGHPLAIFAEQRPSTLIFTERFLNLMENDPRKQAYVRESFDDDGNLTGSFFNGNDLIWGKLDSSVPLISLWELQFIEAEALARTGGDALTSLKAAVANNMRYLELDEEDITNYTDALTSATIADIINEKYKALYGNAPIEAWNDYRRTGFPDLVPDANGTNGNNPSGVVPRRFLYSITERQSNNANYAAAVANQGGHLLDNDLWAWPTP